MARLEGKVAVVTGAARNIGRAICTMLAEEGCDVVVNARASAALAEETAAAVRAMGRRAVVQMGDVTKPADVQALAEAALKHFGRLDILVNNAAYRRQVPFLEMPFEEWREIAGTILDGAFLCTQACLPPMLKACWGRVVNIGGLTGHSGASERAHVVTGKAGLIGFTKAIATEFAGRGITSNCVVPGPIETVRSENAQTRPGQHETPMGRKGHPEEIAAAVRYFVLPDADFTTGQTLHVNGGRYLA
ncbi:MAG: SDR family oxidoreductase [Alphaproteobacteria bacterium]|nr:SDR family oxidoreductase [Alphaproteobacteria bacterium]